MRMVVKPTLAHGLQMCLGNLWKRNDFSDFTVVVEDTSFRCHRFILSACSHFFQGLFRSQMKECLEGHAKLDGMTKGTFDIIFNSIYKGIDGLSEANVLDVWSATELLQIDYLTEEGKKFVICNLSVNNCFRFLNHATMYSAQNVIDHCLNFIIKHFEQVRHAKRFLELKFDYFYKVIASDFLATNSEQSVMDSVLKWVYYMPFWERYSRLDDAVRSLSVCLNQGNDDNKDNNLKKENDCQETENNNQSATLFVIRNYEDTVNVKSNTVMLVDDKTVCNKNGNCHACSTEGDRRKHLFKLISACRLLLLKSNCLESMLKIYRHLLRNTGAYDLVFEALMYTLRIDQRHDSWPEAAVHRASSSNKHVMVFLSNDKFMAYSLNTGSVHEFSELPDDAHDNSIVNINVFDNVLCLMYENTDNCILFSMLKEETEWVCMTQRKRFNDSKYMMLAYGSYIYCSSEHSNPNYSDLLCCFCTNRLNEKLPNIYALKTTVNCLIRFHQYIVVFSTKDNVVTVLCYNTETQKPHECTTSMDGTSEDMVNFRHGDDVYILQRNGSLWKVFSTDTNPVSFELVSKLWDLDCSLKGCVLYKKKLFVFCDEMKQMNQNTLLTSLPGICENTEIIQINSRTQCLPMVLHKSRLT